MFDYKNAVNNIGLYTSDRKRILSLPIYMSKRSQNPEPLRGQKEFDLFTSLTGKDFTSDFATTLDKEQKITEYDFEKYLNPQLLQRVNSQEDFFKNYVRKVNFATNTQYEQL
jgi:hypothetical protein